MTNDFVHTTDPITGFEDFLTKKESQLKALDGNIHFIVGHARSSSSISAIITDEYDENFVFYEDCPAANWALENYAGWYKQLLNEGLKSKAYVRSHIEDYQTEPTETGVELYTRMAGYGKNLYSKYSFGPHGDRYWAVMLKNFPILHENFSQGRYLLTYRSPERALLAMRFFFNEFLKRDQALSEIIHAYHATLELLLYIAKSFQNVYFLNDSEMSEKAVRDLYARFLQRGGDPLNLYQQKNKRAYDGGLVEELKSHDMYHASILLYDELERIRFNRNRAQYHNTLGY